VFAVLDFSKHKIIHAYMIRSYDPWVIQNSSASPDLEFVRKVVIKKVMAFSGGNRGECFEGEDTYALKK